MTVVCRAVPRRERCAPASADRKLLLCLDKGAFLRKMFGRCGAHTRAGGGDRRRSGATCRDVP